MRKFIFPALVLATLSGAAFMHVDIQRDPSPRQILVDRPWFDHLPRNRKDSFEYYVFRRDKQGFFDKAESIHRHHLDLIQWSASDDSHILIKLLHEGRNGDTEFKIEKISPPVDRQLDLKLEIKAVPAHDNSPKIYYSSSRARESSMEDVESFVEGQLEDQ